jgi:hypothetical protein
MAEFDHGTKRIAEATGRQLARVAGIECATWEPLEGTLPITVELLADRVFLASNDAGRFVVYFEFYTTWDAEAPWDILAKSGLLSRREKLPAVCVVVVLQPKGHKPQGGQVRLEVGGRMTQFVRLEEVLLWEVTPEPWWDEEPGLMALYPLCHHGEDAEAAIRHAAESIERNASDVLERRDFLTFLGVYSNMRYPLVNAIDIIGREKMRESAFAREWFEDGSLQTLRASILRVLRSRKKLTQTDEYSSALELVKEKDRLDHLLEVAATCATIDEFRAALS